VVVADDSTEVLQMVSTLLSVQYDLVGKFLDGAPVLSHYAELHPDLVILDISMPHVNGFKVADQLFRLDHPPKIIFLTGYDSQEFVSSAFDAGASAYVLKAQMNKDLERAIIAVTGGAHFISRQVDVPGNRV
jgi:DNA-binding NarL/FixJ family response regulator